MREHETLRRRTRWSLVVMALFALISARSLAADPVKPVPAAQWLLPEGRYGPVPFRNTLRSALPEFLRSFAANWIDNWPGATYIESTHEVAQLNGGHMGTNMGAVVYANLSTLTYQARNKAPGPKEEGAMPGDGTPDEFGVLKAMHGYNGYLTRPASWGYGPDLFVLWTFYGAGPQFNPVAYYDIAEESGGGGVFYKGAANKYFKTVGGYGVAAQVDFMKGFFVGDKVVSPYNPTEKFAFIKGDMSPPDTSWPNPVDQYGSSCLTVDEDHKLLIAVTKGPYLKILDLDPKSPSFRKILAVGIDFPADFPPDEAAKLEPDRAGFRWLKGKGLVGIHKLASDKEAVGIQIRLGARPTVDKARATIVWRGIPPLKNGVFGSHVAIPDLGITFLNTGADTPPLQFNWPRV